jgi:hypothetical protein
MPETGNKFATLLYCCDGSREHRVRLIYKVHCFFEEMPYAIHTPEYIKNLWRSQQIRQMPHTKKKSHHSDTEQACRNSLELKVMQAKFVDQAIALNRQEPVPLIAHFTQGFRKPPWFERILFRNTTKERTKMITELLERECPKSMRLSSKIAAARYELPPRKFIPGEYRTHDH